MLTKLDPKLDIGLHKLYIEEKLLHRDINVGNLSYEIVNGKPVTIFLTFELATRVNNATPYGEVRTGTAPFMAREVLKGYDSVYKHTLNYDLESVYYTAGWYISGYRGYKQPTFDNIQSDPLWDWRDGSFEDMCNVKEKHMSNPPSVDVFDIPDDANDAIYSLNGVRTLYHDRGLLAKGYDAAKGRKESMAIRENKRQAIKDGASKDEIKALVTKMKREFRKKKERRKLTNAISFREWMVGGDLMDIEDINCDCDSCNDEMAKVLTPSG